MNNDFAEFAQGFRERTAKRLLEFEKRWRKRKTSLKNPRIRPCRRHGGRRGKWGVDKQRRPGPDMALPRRVHETRRGRCNQCCGGAKALGVAGYAGALGQVFAYQAFYLLRACLWICKGGVGGIII